MRRDRRGLIAATAAGMLAAAAGRAHGQVPPDGLAGQARAAGFTFGTAINTNWLAADPAYGAQILAEAQVLVPEWEGKWAPLQPSPGNFEFGPLGTLITFAQTNGRQLRGHALVWHEAMPAWLPGSLAEGPARARSILAAHMDGVLAATRNVVRDWDVVNEAVGDTPGNPFTAPNAAPGEWRDTPWLRALGPGYIDLAFRLARERDSTLRLTYNDYGLEGDTPWAEEKRQRVLRLLRRLLDAKCPVDALGTQAHLMLDEPFRPEPYAAFLRAVRGMGLAVLITELDVREAAQVPADLAARDALVADRVRAVVGTALDNGCRTVLTWGLSDKDSWLVRDPDVMRKDGRSHRGLPLDQAGRRKPMWQVLGDSFASRGQG